MTLPDSRQTDTYAVDFHGLHCEVDVLRDYNTRHTSAGPPEIIDVRIEGVDDSDFGDWLMSNEEFVAKAGEENSE